MATKEFHVTVDENGNEIARVEIPEKKGVFDTLKDMFSKFGNEHPKIAKGAKIGAGAALVGASIAVGVAIANKNNNSDEYGALPDNVEALPDYSEPESDTDTETTDVDEATETTE